jgi:hypothetical protein
MDIHPSPFALRSAARRLMAGLPQALGLGLQTARISSLKKRPRGPRRENFCSFGAGRCHIRVEISDSKVFHVKHSR